ncbi:MAG: HupE/UreJ family protein [Bacteroidia bacterium]
MNLFKEFFHEGFFHIVDVDALDHILFLFAIVAIYNVSEWKKILWVITSFTIAHSLSLALSLLNIINLPSHLVEFLIACTIAFTCMENLFLKKLHPYRVLLSGFFGLIHGLGFSTSLKSLFSPQDLNLFTTLFPFNLGIECGQLVIITFIFIAFIVFQQFGKASSSTMNKVISYPVLLISLYWMITRF